MFTKKDTRIFKPLLDGITMRALASGKKKPCFANSGSKKGTGYVRTNTRMNKPGI